MASVTFLGTGTGSAQPGRFQASILLRSQETHILLDAGEPCTNQLLNLGVALPDLDAVWITHGHSDHIGGLPFLLQASWIHRRTEAFPVGLPAYLVDPLKAWLRVVLIPTEILPYSVEMFGWEAGSSRESAGITVTPHPTSHLDRTMIKMNEPSLECFLFEIEAEGKRIIYSGDIGSAQDLIPHLQKPVDLLICELGHVTPDDLIPVLKDVKVETLCLTHLSQDANERLGDIELLFAENLPLTQNVYLPEDGERIDF